MSAQFGLQHFFGTIGGSALATDSDPNSVAPAAERVFRLKKTNYLPGLRVYGFGGTTCASVLWVKEPGLGLWLRATASITTTPSAPGNTTTIQKADGAEAFLQVVTNTGVQALGLVYG